MITAYASLQREDGSRGRIKITTDRDCLPPDALKVTKEIFTDEDQIAETAEMYFARGYSVCVDLGETFYEFEQ